jgi:phosphoenolpyruvate carboxykinase (GTP)
MTTEATHTDQRAGGTTHAGLQAWVDEVAAMTTPDHVEWVTGSDAEWTRLTDKLVEAGTFVRLNEEKKPNSFYAASDPTDVARVEDRTFICSVDEKDAGPTNNWMGPEEMKDLMPGLYAGCMKGRTMFGENSRVLKWAIERIEGKAAAIETPIGHVPTPESL